MSDEVEEEVEQDADLVEEEIDEDAIEPDLDDADGVDLATGDDDFGETDDDDDDDDDEEDAESRPKARKVEEEDEDDDEVDPDDVEADLDAILKNRMATEDDDDEEDDDAATGAVAVNVPGKGVDEFVCGMCFLVVSREANGPNPPPCSMGDGVEPCHPLDG